MLRTIGSTTLTGSHLQPHENPRIWITEAEWMTSRGVEAAVGLLPWACFLSLPHSVMDHCVQGSARAILHDLQGQGIHRTGQIACTACPVTARTRCPGGRKPSLPNTGGVNAHQVQLSFMKYDAPGRDDVVMGSSEDMHLNLVDIGGLLHGNRGLVVPSSENNTLSPGAEELPELQVVDFHLVHSALWQTSRRTSIAAIPDQLQDEFPQNPLGSRGIHKMQTKLQGRQRIALDVRVVLHCMTPRPDSSVYSSRGAPSVMSCVGVGLTHQQGGL